jgi:DNA-binding transcriptional LysR family regulator
VVSVPLELPADLLPRALAELSAACPLTRVEVEHASSAAQLAALQAGDVDVALVRERPADPKFDAVLAVEEALGVILATARATELADPAGVRPERLAGLDWTGFPRSETPVWYDQVAATLRAHGLSVPDQPRSGDHPLIAEVKMAAAPAGRSPWRRPAGTSRCPGVWPGIR